MTSRTVAFLGCGRITRAVAQGLVAVDGRPWRLRGVSRHGRSARDLAADTGLVAAGNIAEAVAGAGLVVVAVHPHEAAEVLAETRPHLTDGQILVSLVASWPVAVVAEAVRHAVPVLRAVPNVAVAARVGATVLSAAPAVEAAELTPVQELFADLGPVFVVDDHHLETVSALSGAGPALLARFAQSLAEGAAALGLPPGLADHLARHAVRGTGALLDGAGTTFAGTISSVSSPGGMTEQALDTLDHHGLPAATTAALDAAVRLSLRRMPATGTARVAGAEGGAARLP
ncbi:pyrroline-5-carboxylate reductase dimerization domain-containing protein [Streptomyces sp. NPDC047061]|uniref:pyrroline-5-carboxylate reductase family protein n=1 Tax=Streptomyces sp. NPDC047061 TaxID=3154605 RepID=UPI0033E3AFD7